MNETGMQTSTDNISYVKRNGITGIIKSPDKTAGNIPDSKRISEDVSRLEEQERWLYQAAVDIPVPVAIFDRNLNIVYTNNYFVKITGYSKDKISCLNFSGFNSEFNVKQLEGQNVQDCLETKREASGKFRMKFRSSERIVEIRSFPVTDKQGNIIGMNCAFIDITDTARITRNIEAELANIADNIKCIAGGKSADFKQVTCESDTYTQEIRTKFFEISSSATALSKTFQNILSDIHSLANACANGRLDFKIDESGYEGSYKELVSDLNNLLESVAVPLKEAIRVSDSYSDADFKERFSDRITVKGDFLELKCSVNNIGESIAELLSHSHNIAKMITANSTEIGKGTDEVSKAAEGVANASQKTADLTRDLLNSIEEVNRRISDLSASSEEIAGTSQEVFTAARDVVEKGREAESLGNDANKRMSDFKDISQTSAREITELNEKVGEVGKVIKLINDITGQINLLSLNAAIEAARAGEYGRGFAVVAGEVKNLAGEARAATSTIEEVVSMVQKSSENTAKAITTANSEISEGVESVTKAISALNTIIRDADLVSKDIGEIAKAVKDQAEISTDIVAAMESETEKTKNVQREAEELAALAEESSASIEEIGSAMHEVNSYVSELEDANSRFSY